nr:alcohol dehydrogenase [Rhizobium sp. Q54]
MRILYYLVIGLLVLIAAAVAYAISPTSIDAVERPDAQSFDQAAVQRGEQLAMIGNCADCHTAERGEPYAGGRAIPTPFGTIHGTNITPDPETGIGNWSEEAFRRAMYEGLDREGNHLYPAFPYHHFTKVVPEDIHAIYAYLMTLEPVRNEVDANDLSFPFNMRPLLAGWKLLFLDNERFVADAGAGDAVNHGAYLVEGLAHCGGCHTPRNLLQAEKDGDQYLQGELTENWWAPAIAGDVHSPGSWDQERLKAYLTANFVEHHGVALGPMAPVAQNLARVPEEDSSAIATYLATLIKKDEAGEAEAAERAAPATMEITGAAEPADDPGAAIYESACAGCHDQPSSRFASGLQLAYSTSLQIPTPQNLIQIIRHGVKPPEGRPGYFMPGFDAALTDRQITDLAAYLRNRFTTRDAWEDLDDAVADSGEASAMETAGTE